MGTTFSRAQEITSDDSEVFLDCESMDATINTETVENETTEETDEGKRGRSEEMVEFRKELAIKREQRRQLLAKHKEDRENLKKSLELERKAKQEICEENHLLRCLLKKNNIDISCEPALNVDEMDFKGTVNKMKDEFENLKENNRKLRRDLAETNLNLQRANADIADLGYENVESMKHIKALKEVVNVSKTMLGLRDKQLLELKEKLSQIEQSLADKETKLLSTDLRQEYEKQLQNIRTLRTLYEERARLAEVTRQNLLKELEEQKQLNEVEINKSIELSMKVEGLEATVTELNEVIENKHYQILSSQGETHCLKTEMSAVNMLFSQMLLGYKSNQNLDKLIHRLEENHGLLAHMVEREDDSKTSSALPKLLLELVNQVDEEDKSDCTKDGSEVRQQSEQEIANASDHESSLNTTAEEIVENLPKVWRVLMELLSHQAAGDDKSTEQKYTTCYKSVDTASGPVMVPSVSQTYIRLKDLILEKLALIKEVNKMKQLNGHLESRLGEQERRLCLVTSELSKTWHVVGRLRRHHHQLHTHEKILKYELQQKRKMLNELKEELEYCREKWDKAREKNSESERQWKKLRAEFSNRENKLNSPSFNNSAESGYSDERQTDTSESNDESEYVNEPPLRCKKKFRKSIDNIDFSADLNLVAEREDPISDMLDVADLPLDSQDAGETVYLSTSTSAKCEESTVIPSPNENILQTQNTYDQTEEENENKSNECGVENSSYEECSEDTWKSCMNSENTVTSVIQESISETEEIYKSENEKETITRENDGQLQLKEPAVEGTIAGTIDVNISEITLQPNLFQTSAPEANTSSMGPTTDPAAIFESIKRQNERLARKDKKLQQLESSSSALLSQTQKTLQLGEKLNTNLEKLLNHNTCSDNSIISFPSSESIQNESLESRNDSSDNSVEFTKLCSEDIKINSDNIVNSTFCETSPNRKEVSDNENSTTSTINSEYFDQPENGESSSLANADHVARFAARDERLKRLEEQAKSLVSKVNNTRTKRIKLNYKLEELHNIYGSENSRGGSPSGDNEDKESDDETANE